MWIQRIYGITPNLPTDVIPTEIAWLTLSGKFPTDMRIPPIELKILLESNPPKAIILVRRLAVQSGKRTGLWSFEPSRGLVLRQAAVLGFETFASERQAFSSLKPDLTSYIYHVSTLRSPAVGTFHSPNPLDGNIYIYIYIYTCMCMYVYIYIYIYEYYIYIYICTIHIYLYEYIFTIWGSRLCASPDAVGHSPLQTANSWSHMCIIYIYIYIYVINMCIIYIYIYIHNTYIYIYICLSPSIFSAGDYFTISRRFLFQYNVHWRSWIRARKLIRPSGKTRNPPLPIIIITIIVMITIIITITTNIITIITSCITITIHIIIIILQAAASGGRRPSEVHK